MRSHIRKYCGFTGIACLILIAVALLHGAYAAGGYWTYLAIAAVWGTCIFVAKNARESGFIVLYGCLAAILLYRVSPAELFELMNEALTEHGLVLKVMLISLAVALLIRRDLFKSAEGSDLRTDVRRRDILCIIHTFADYMRKRKRRTGRMPSFPATFLTLLLPMLPGVADPSDAAKTAHGIWTSNQYKREEVYRSVRPGILCCSTLFSLLPVSVWMLTFIYLTGGALAGVHLPEELGQQAGSIIGSSVPVSFLMSMVVPALYGLLSYLHGVYLVRRAGHPTWRDDETTAENIRPWCRNLGFVGLTLLVFLIAGASAWIWGAHHESVGGVRDVVYKLAHEIDAWYACILVGLIGALLIATALSEYLISGSSLRRTLEKGDWKFLEREVREAAPVCFTVFLLFLFYLLQKRAIEHAHVSHSVFVTLFLAASTLGLVTWLAAKPFLVFALPYLVLSGAQEQLGGQSYFFLLQCLLLVAAFCSQFSPQSVGVESLYGHEVRKWREVLTATRVSPTKSCHPFWVQVGILVLCACASFFLTWKWTH